MNKSANTQCTLDQEETDTDLKKKDKYISFRLLQKEVSELDAMAQSENLDRSKFIRSRIFAQNTKAA